MQSQQMYARLWHNEGGFNRQACLTFSFCCSLCDLVVSHAQDADENVDPAVQVGFFRREQR